MTTISFDIVGFDLDGTLVDSAGDLANAVNVALAAAGRTPLTRDQVEPMIGGGAKNLLAHVLEATGGCASEEFRRLYKIMLGYYEAHLSVETRPYPGAIAAIDVLRAAGVKTAVVTNKFESLAERLLTDLAMRDRFDTVIGGDTLGKGLAKPDRAPIDEMVRRCGGGRAAFVGDSIYDIEAAHNAGIPAIAVSFGFLLQPVETLGADAVIDRYEQLVPALAALGG